MTKNRFLIASLLLGVVGAAWAARYVRREQASGLAADPLLGWSGEAAGGRLAAGEDGAPERGMERRRDSMPSPTAPLGAA